LPEPIADYRGARGSNAGDQFHELWALEQVLKLLTPGTPLQGATVEGVLSEAGSDGEQHWDGVDCALYFGGQTLESAQRIELIRLKYSGTPSDAWSVARLTASSAERRNNSVLRRLAEAYRGARRQARTDAAIRIRLVSNQSIALSPQEVFSLILSDTQTPSGQARDVAAVTTATGGTAIR